MSESEDPLEELYVEKDDFDRNRMYSALNGVIAIDRETGDPVFKGFHELNAKEKLISYLLFRRSLLALDEIEEEDLGVTSSELEDEAGINAATVRSYNSQLSYIKRSEDAGGYVIPNHAIGEAIDELSD